MTEKQFHIKKIFHPFGMMIKSREFVAFDSYKYGFNGQEKNDEVSGSGNHNTAMFWEYDTRLGRRWNLDPEPIPGISDYACFTNSPIWLNDVLGNSVDVGKKKELKKETAVIEKHSMNADEGDVDENLQVKKQTTYYTDASGKNLSNSEVKAIQSANQKIRTENAGIIAHNKAIDRKIALFEGAGFKANYNAETGLLDDAIPDGAPMESYQQTLFDAIKSDKTYTLNTGGKNAFSFGGKTSGTISNEALNNPNKPVLQKVIAADAAAFLGKMSSQEDSFSYLLNKSYPKDNNPTINIDANKIHLNYEHKLRTKTLQNPSSFSLTK